MATTESLTSLVSLLLPSIYPPCRNGRYHLNFSKVFALSLPTPVNIHLNLGVNAVLDWAILSCIL